MIIAPDLHAGLFSQVVAATMIHPQQDWDGATAISGWTEVQDSRTLALTFSPPKPTRTTRANWNSNKASYHQQEQPTGPGFVNEDADGQHEHQMGVSSLPKGLQIRAWAGAAHSEEENLQGS